MADPDLQKRARELFNQVSKRGNLHGREFTMMSKSDDEIVRLIADTLQGVQADA